MNNESNSNTSTNKSNKNLWQEYELAHLNLWNISKKLQEEKNKIATIHYGFKNGNVSVAINALHDLKGEDLISFFDILINMVISLKFGDSIHDLILRMPRDWVLANIEKEVEKLLSEEDVGDYLDYQMILKLYLKLDKNLVRKLAGTILEDEDEDMREVGEHYFNLVKGM